MSTVRLFAMVVVALPGVLHGQDPVERLRDALPLAVAEQVVAVVQEAVARELPGGAVASLALEGVAKGRTGDEVVTAVRALLGDLDAARSALETGGRAVRAGEIETATLVMRQGVDGAAIRALAESHRSGRSLIVPLAVAGQLAQRGLPADHAIALVQERLAAADAELMALPEEVDRALAHGAEPGEARAALAAALAGFDLPIPTLGIPPVVLPRVPANGGIGGMRPGLPTMPPVGPPAPGSGRVSP